MGKIQIEHNESNDEYGLSEHKQRLTYDEWLAQQKPSIQKMPRKWNQFFFANGFIPVNPYELIEEARRNAQARKEEAKDGL